MPMVFNRVSSVAPHFRQQARSIGPVVVDAAGIILDTIQVIIADGALVRGGLVTREDNRAARLILCKRLAEFPGKLQPNYPRVSRYAEAATSRFANWFVRPVV